MSRMVMKKAGICFPCEPFGYCPAAIKGFIPGTWQKIQDTTHCMLVLGLVSSLTMLLMDVIDLFSFGECFYLSNFFCAKEIFILLFGAPFFWYCAMTIQQYDQDLQEKQKMVKAQMNQLLDGLKDLVGEMEGLLTSAAESTTGMAEKNFDGARRDFQRFLKSAKDKFGQIAMTENRVVEEFKKFVLHWLDVFQECSIDPVSMPRVIIDKEELDRCVSVQEIADLTLERLRVTEVKFLSAKRDDDKQRLAKRTGTVQRLKQNAKKPLAIADGKEENLIDEVPEDDDDVLVDRITWVSCGKTDCGCSARDEGGFPLDCNCFCAGFTILSASHRMLLISFILGALLIPAEIGLLIRGMAAGANSDYPDNGNPVLLLLVAGCQLSLLTVLYRFEAIDIVEQLKREVETLQKDNEEVQQEREDMKEFWSQANELAEVWLYRTSPRLEITKEVHEQISLMLDDYPDGVYEALKAVNPVLTNIETKVGAIQDWKGNETIDLKKKKAFADKMSTIARGEDFDNMVSDLKVLRLGN